MIQEDRSKPVDETQGTGDKPPHPDAIHDRYPPIGTKEHQALHKTPPLEKQR